MSTSGERSKRALKAGPRTALLIGNRSYKDAPLQNPLHDARDMDRQLTKLGFQTILKLDVGQAEMEEAIGAFGASLQGGGVGLFYFAGHGIQLEGVNYLLPVGANIRRQKDLKYKAIHLGQVLDEMELARNGLNILILDACRNNPLPRSFRSGLRGLARVKGPKGTLIAYATAPGSVARDGEGRNGVYTKHLLEAIRQPGLSLEQTFKRVLQGVDRETKGKQTPWTSTSFTGDFYFSP